MSLSHDLVENQKQLKNLKMSQKNLQDYWKTNLKYLAILLSIWFFVSFGCGILFVEQLNQIRIGGFKLGFWFAQQGAILVFVILIYVYIYLMNKLDKEYDVDEK
jgi:putative solute:sodium symporter small subunit